MGFGSFGMQKSNQQQSSGLDRGTRNYFSGLTPGYVNRLNTQANTAANDPGGLRFQSDVDRLLPVGPYGLNPGSSAGVFQLGRDLVSQNSGARTLRGFNSPNSIDAVFGDALRMASPQLIPQTEAYALERAKLAPQLASASFGYQQAPLEALMKLISGSSQGSGSSFGFNASGGYKA